jgi:DNA-directed RNA polymerase specialized sigma24 family protein
VLAEARSPALLLLKRARERLLNAIERGRTTLSTLESRPDDPAVHGPGTQAAMDLRVLAREVLVVAGRSPGVPEGSRAVLARALAGLDDRETAAAEHITLGCTRERLRRGAAAVRTAIAA